MQIHKEKSNRPYYGGKSIIWEKRNNKNVEESEEK